MIYSVCVYLIKDGKWLMLYRNKKKNDANHNKWIGVGGKIEAGETALACAHREVFEETGYLTDTMKEEGTVLFHSPGYPDERITVYSCYDFHGNMSTCNEGHLEWISEENLMKLPLWQGDRIFMKRMLAKEKECFSLIFQYDENGLLTAVKEEGKDE